MDASAASQPLLPPGSVDQPAMADSDSEAGPLELGLGSGNGDASGAVGTGSHELRDAEVTVQVTVAQDAEGKAAAADHVDGWPAPHGAETEAQPLGQAAPGEPMNVPAEEAVAQHRAHFYKHSLRHHAAVVWQQEMQAWTLLALISTIMYGLVVLAHTARAVENNRQDGAPPKDGSPDDASSDSGFTVNHLAVWSNILACVLTVIYFRLMGTLMARRKHALAWVDACLTALQQLATGRTGVIAATAAAAVTAAAGVSVVVADAPGGVGAPAASAATAAGAHENEVWAGFERACGPLRGGSGSHKTVVQFPLKKGFMVFGGAVCVCGVGGTLLSSMSLMTEYWIFWFSFGWLPANA